MFALDSVDTVEKWYFFLLSSNTEDSSVLPPLPFLLQINHPFPKNTHDKSRRR